MTDRLTFRQLVGGPRDGETVHASHGLPFLELPFPRGDQEDPTDTVRYLPERLVLAGVVVEVWLYRSPGVNRDLDGTLDRALVAIARRACR